MKQQLHQISQFLRHSISAKGDLRMHSPYVYNMMRAVFSEQKETDFWKKIEDRRKDLKRKVGQVTSPDPGSGSIDGNRPEMGHLLSSSAISRRKGQFLARLAKFIDARKICELGTSAGLGSAYLYSLNHSEIHTVEGRPEVFQIAEETKSKLGIPSMHCYCGLFEEQMGNLETHGPFDIIFIDGNHKAEPSKLYVNWAKQQLTENGLIILDDIYWSNEMTHAWEDIRSQTDVKLSLDFYHLGVIGYHPSFLQAQHFNLKWPLF